MTFRRVIWTNKGACKDVSPLSHMYEHETFVYYFDSFNKCFNLEWGRSSWLLCALLFFFFFVDDRSFSHSTPCIHSFWTIIIIKNARKKVNAQRGRTKRKKNEKKKLCSNDEPNEWQTSSTYHIYRHKKIFHWDIFKNLSYQKQFHFLLTIIMVRKFKIGPNDIYNRCLCVLYFMSSVSNVYNNEMELKY